MDDYDCGLINDWGGGNVEWWQDYIRAEIGRANDHWRAQIATLTPASDGRAEGLREAAEIAYSVNAERFREKYEVQHKRKVYQAFMVDVAVNRALDIQAEDARDAILARAAAPPPAPAQEGEP